MPSTTQAAWGTNHHIEIEVVDADNLKLIHSTAHHPGVLLEVITGADVTAMKAAAIDVVTRHIAVREITTPLHVAFINPASVDISAATKSEEVARYLVSGEWREDM